jgi:L-asparaginase
MQSLFDAPPSPSRVVVLATGGTIAGTAASAVDTLGYRAAQLSVRDLVIAVPALADVPLDTEQVAQVDSKDMEFAIWRRLAERTAHHLARPEVAGIVITHGTDTLEETAYFLQRVLAPAKPVLLTGAMHPATALQPDGPQNLVDAVSLALSSDGPPGVSAVMGGRVLAALDVRKHHARRLDAFGSGDAGDLGVLQSGRFKRFRAPPAGEPLGLAWLDAAWPRVELVVSHAGARGELVDALVADGVDGIVALGTGNGTLHHALEAALLRAQQSGVVVRVSTRVASGDVVPVAGSALTVSSAATAVQARIELMLELMGLAQGRSSGPPEAGSA